MKKNKEYTVSMILLKTYFILELSFLKSLNNKLKQSSTLNSICFSAKTINNFL